MQSFRLGDERNVSVFNDITDSWRNDERIRHLAFHDELTGLPNRSVLIDRLTEIIDSAREGHCLAVMFIDLDAFKDEQRTVAVDAIVRSEASAIALHQVDIVDAVRRRKAERRIAARIVKAVTEGDRNGGRGNRSSRR